MTPLIIALIVIALVVLWAVGAYNGLIRLRNRASNAWAQVEVQLKRRWDLIPNLVETVKGYARHESETLERVIAARNTAVSAKNPADQQAADNLLTGALRQLFAVAEAYPDLKANQNFLDLQAQLTDTENKVSVSRQIYNDTVLTYNNKVETVPSAFIARMFGFEIKPFFDAPDQVDEPPTVSF